MDPSTTSVATTSLLGIAAVQRVFHFLDGPAEVLRAASASHRWYELATADSVWRAKAVREGIVEKAGVFEVPLPPVGRGWGELLYLDDEMRIQRDVRGDLLVATKVPPA